MTDPFFEDYCTRTLPEYLRQTEAPDTYPSQRAWEEARAADIAKHRAECLTVYNQRLSMGWRPEELASGDMGEQHADGSPVRWQDRLTAGARRAAKQAVIELHDRNIKLDSLSQGILEAATYSPNPPSEKQTAEIIKQAKRLCQGHDYALGLEAQVVKEQPQITVYVALKCIGGKKYPRGVYLISLEEEAALLIWLGKMGAEVERRGHVEAGFPEWPPFRIDRLGMRSADGERSPQQAPADWRTKPGALWNPPQEHALSQEPKT